MALVAKYAISSEYQQGTDAFATGKQPYGEWIWRQIASSYDRPPWRYRGKKIDWIPP
jgi:hypothetical protein